MRLFYRIFLLLAILVSATTLLTAGPRIEVPPSQALGLVLCDSVLIDSVKIKNTGDADLTISSTSLSPSGSDFTILRPAGSFTVRRGDSAYVVIRLKPSGLGPRSATLAVNSNDPSNPQRTVVLSGELKIYTASLDTADIDFGEICTNAIAYDTIHVLYDGGIDGSIGQITLSNGADVKTFQIIRPDSTSESRSLKSQRDTQQVIIAFSPIQPGAFSNVLQIPVGQCNLILRVNVRGTAIDIDARLNSASSVNFGKVPVGRPPAQTSVTLQQWGRSSGRIIDLFVRPPQYASEFILPMGIIGRVLGPSFVESFNFSYRPTKLLKIDSAFMCVVFGGGSCLDTVCVKVQGEGVAPLLLFDRAQLSYSADSCSEPVEKIFDTVYLHNYGTYPANIGSASSNNSRITIKEPLNTNLIQPGDSLRVVIQIEPTKAGATTAKIILPTDDPDSTKREMVIDITLKLESTVIKLLLPDSTPVPSGIDFGTAYGCGPRTDTFRLKNAGTLQAVVTGGFAQGTAFKLSPPPPYPLLGNADTAIAVLFDPPTPGEYRDTLMLQNGSCSDQVIRVAVAGRRYQVSQQVTGIDFGPSVVGQTRYGSSTFINTSKTPLDTKMRVVDAFVRPPTPEFVIPSKAQFPIEIAPNEDFTFDVMYQPTGPTTSAAELCFVTENPCLDTICVPLDGSGVQSDIFARQSVLNFGTRFTCQSDTTLQLAILNLGNLPLQVLDLVLTDPGAVAFEQVSTVTKPHQLQPKDSLMVTYRFIASRAPADGIVTATLKIISDDSRQDTLNVLLTGRRRSYSVSAPAFVDFGRTLAGVPPSPTRTVTLVNNSPDTVRIDRFDIRPPYTILPPVPSKLGPGDTVMLTVEFTPADTLIYNDTLRVIFGGVCVDTTLTALTGEGRPPVAGFSEIIIPTTLTGAPGDTILIPIILQSSNLLEEVGATTVRLRLRYNHSMLEPLRFADGTGRFGKKEATSIARVLNRKVQGDEMLLTVELTNNPIPTAPDTLGMIEAAVLLGNSTTTPIRIDSLGWADVLMKNTQSDGLFTLKGYCDAGGSRLLKVSGAFGIISISPNPFNPSTEIVFETVERGPTTLAIYNAAGQRVATLVDRENLPVQAHVRSWDATPFPSGLYYAELTTPTQRSLRRLVLAK
ncbi:MAG: choice-of-anchor D domain-containing protein [Armatimonadetes bacterium]|nr:choice-of-anchor D domain-containing protein [Armatimonadota bacterium]